MANEFIIKKGHSSRLNLIAQEDLIENGWYLTTDTAEVYVALRQANGLLALKKINDCDIDNDLDLDSFESRLQALEAERTHVYGYRKDFPSEGERDHMYIAEDQKRTYIYCNNTYLPIADQFDYTDHDNNSNTPEVRIIYGGAAN
jgi:hypothetical protein